MYRTVALNEKTLLLSLSTKQDSGVRRRTASSSPRSLDSLYASRFHVKPPQTLVPFRSGALRRERIVPSSDGSS